MCSLFSIEATGVFIPIGNSGVLLVACNNRDIIEFLSFRHKSILAGDMNAKHPI
jgi:hypothetical protein